MMKQLHWVCTARGAHKCEKYHFAFPARQPFFSFLKSGPGRHGPEVPKFVFMSVCFERHGHAQSIPQFITSSVGSPPT